MISSLSSTFYLCVKVADVLRGGQEILGRPGIVVLMLREKLELGTDFCLKAPFTPQRKVRNCTNL